MTRSRSRWLRCCAAVLALMLLFACDSSAPPPAGGNPDGPAPGEVFTASDGTRFGVETAATGLEVPWALAFAPDGRLFVTERPGRVRILSAGRLLPDPALTLTDVAASGEAGLLGLALHPRFAENRFVYLAYTARLPSGDANRVVRYREAANTLADPAVILDELRAASIHDGGRLRFGPDGMLYYTIGDVAEPSVAQDLGSLNGKILRLNDDGTTPSSNPYGSPIYSYGHRNPQGLDWHPASRQLWATEHGAAGNDEVNRIEAGANYGWPVIEGAQARPDMRAPVLFFNPSIAPSGASFYRGTAIAGFRNDFFFATLRGQHVHRVRFDPADANRVVSHEALLENRYGRLRDIVTGPDGALYFCTNNRDGRGTPGPDDDRILKIVAAR